MDNDTGSSCIWKPVPNWADYEVSNTGTVRSLPRRKWTARHNGPVIFESVTLKPSFTAKGYAKVRLSDRRHSADKYVHRLVMHAFIGPCPAGLEVCHKNGNPADNRLSNLRYGTRSENALDRHRHGTMDPATRSAAPSSKLSESQVRWVRDNSKNLSFREMARRLGVHHKTISNIIWEVSWRPQ